jgi:hypothetical protein
MKDTATYESVAAESERALNSFLHRELELTATLLDLARIEIEHRDDAGASQAMGFARRGIATIHRYLPHVRPSDRKQIARELRPLERLLHLHESAHGKHTAKN